MKSSSMLARGPVGSALRQVYQAGWGYFFVAPAALLFLVFILYPLAQGLYLSFFKAGLSPVRTFVGLDNFRRLFGDPGFIRAVLNTLAFVLGVVPLALVLSLGTAVLIFPLSNRVQSFYRLAFYLPGVASGVVLSLVWLWIYQPTYGLLNYVLGLAGVPRVAWLGEPQWALPALGLVVLSWILGQPVILFLAGLGAISPELSEAASIDGAGAWTQLRRITLPLLKPTVLFVLLTQTIAVMQTVVVVIVMTRGGPANATQTIVYRIYETAFDFYQFGYASAMGVVLLALVGVITAIQFRLLGQEVEF
jgi:multiple sugar transport system permease protein